MGNDGTLYITTAGKAALLALGTPGWLHPRLDLCTTLPAPPKLDAAVGDFVKMAYTGYAQDSVTITDGQTDPSTQLPYGRSNLGVFVGPSDDSAGGTAIGFVIGDASTPFAVWAWGKFNDPGYQMQVSTDALGLIFTLGADLSSGVFVPFPTGLT